MIVSVRLSRQLALASSIARFYFEVRTEPDMVARRDWTRRWFGAAMAGSDDLVTSLATIAELQAGEFPGKQDALELFADLPLLDLT